MYKATKLRSRVQSAKCDKCNSTRAKFISGNIICDNCGNMIASSKTRRNKYNAVKTVAKDGIKRDSKFEASDADDLYLRQQAGDIKGYDSQYKVTIPIYNDAGDEVLKVTHKIDFRIHHNDGSFELLESKGVETADYRWRRTLLEKIWLPAHKDHTYTVHYQNDKRKRKVLK